MYEYGELIKVAKLYYLKRKPLRAIAKELKTSIATVSRMLAEASRVGIVKFEITDPRERVEILERSLARRFELVKSLVISQNVNDSQSSLKRLLALHSTNLVIETLSPGVIVGIGPGETIAELVSSFTRDHFMEDIKLVPLMGGWSLYDLEHETNKLVTEFASVLGSDYHILPAPAYVSSQNLRELIMKEPQISAITQLWKHIDTAIFSIGPEIEHGLFRQLVPDENHISEAKKLGAVGDILGYLIDENGNVLDIDFNRKLVSIPLEELRNIPVRIGIGGGRLKYRAIKAALKAKYVNILVTDSETASRLLNEEGGIS
ncbi:sugar-binding transcriptional regulator [Pseudothermotoga elfii]|jgi:deoxyribonucleoside regulator